MARKWIYKTKSHKDFRVDQASFLGFGLLESKILTIRGIDNYTTARQFFKPKLSDIHDPFLMKDMQEAVDRIVRAIENKEKILLYGDYDVDGTSSVALMYLYLSEIYDIESIDFYIPERNLEGYGLSTEGIDFAKKNEFSLIICLDCGIRSIDKVQYASLLGIDLIICDHHLPGDTLPEASAVLDPKRSDCRYPYKELSGCGVGFKLCQALNTIYKISEQDLYELTDLLVISIASDIVPITGENRLFAKMGLKTLRKTKRPGLRALLSNEKIVTANISDIVFGIAPKINAAGRIAHAKTAVELMISENEENSLEIAKLINDFNSTRRELDSNITQSAVNQVKKMGLENNSTNVVYQADWNKGVIGIVASRLIETYYKPTVVFTDGNNGEMVASARSVGNFNLYEALNDCSDLFLKFGGHSAAAGLSMAKENFEIFKEKFESIVKKKISENEKIQSIEIDAAVKMEDLSEDFFRFLKKLAPFGPGNMKPVLVLKNLQTAGFVKKIGKSGDHLKFYVSAKDSKKTMSCVAFGMAKYSQEFEHKQFDIAFTPEENNWNGDSSYFLNIKDVCFK